MDLPLAFTETATMTVVLCVARVGGFVAIGTLPLAPGLPLLVRVALAWAMSIAALAWVLPSRHAVAESVPLVQVALTEVAVGGFIGLSVACVTAAAGWAGGVLSSISGLSWAEDYGGGPSEAATPLARLVWWVAAAAFVSSGGGRVLLVGLLESFATLPLGVGFDAEIAGMLTRAFGLAWRLAIAVALPALVAVLAWHLSAALACRVIPLSPSTGLLQGSAAVVLLCAVWLGGTSWTSGLASATTVACEQIFDQVTPSTGVHSP